MNQYRVTVIPVHGEIKEHLVDGDDGPNFKDMYRLLGCNMIEITGCRVGGKNYELYIDEEGRFKEKYDEPAIGRSLIMSPFNQYFTWQTTTITEIVEQRDNYVKFKTQNSNYELFKL